MTPGLLGFVIGFVLLAIGLINFIAARMRRRRPRPVVMPEFAPRHLKPRAVTRLRKENLTWEI